MIDGCGLLGRSNKYVQTHQKAKHGWESIEECMIQSLAPQHKLFRVQEAPREDPQPRAEPATPTAPSPSEPQLRNFRERFFSQRNALRGDQSVSYDGLRHQVSPLHQRTRYLDILRNKDYTQLRDAFTFGGPGTGEVDDKSSFLMVCMQYILLKGESHVQLLTRRGRQILASFSEREIVMKQFRVVQQVESLEKYARVFRAFFIFLLNTHGQLDGGPQASYHSLYHLMELEHATLEFVKMELEDLRSNPEHPDAPPFKLSAFDRSHAHHLSPTNDGFSHEEEEEEEEEEDHIHYGYTNEIEHQLDTLGHPGEGEGSEEHMGASLGEMTGTQPGESLQTSSGLDKKLLNDLFGMTPWDPRQIEEVAGLLEDLFLNLVKKNSIERGQHHPITAFLACYAMDYRSQVIKQAGQMSQVYSAFIYSALMTCLASEYPKWEPEPRGIQVSESLRQFMRQWFLNQTESIMGDILDLRAYAQGINKTSTSQIHHIHQMGPHHLQLGQLDLTQS